MSYVIQTLKDELLNSYTTEEGILCFKPKSTAEKAQDKYENISNNIDFYTWLAYGIDQSQNDAKSVYSRINNVLLRELNTNKIHLTVLDVGCGVGRTLYDVSPLYNKVQFIGFDYSVNMLRRAKQILFDNKLLQIDLSTSGLVSFELIGKNQTNVHLVQGDAMDLPFKLDSVDVMVNTFLIDRVKNVRLALEQMIAVLKPGGLFILTSPLNFQTTNNWKYGNQEILIELLKELGIEELVTEDNILHTEVLDARGNSKVWNTLMVYGKKIFP
ncbi:MAG: ubiquinone/menaquinone biosynthesis C-methylase UbiE [Salibacteraceae bacterium]|jgi:ubiquinone/menaquinone biosynthesis C-methylase UbiE|tara:strand:- start:1256 stop:2068 length:813 start_codon:yes stop_codon:yes gene_type:complete